MHPFINIATAAARRAGHLITRAVDNGDNLTVTQKSSNDFVTEVDKRCEAIIIEEIHKAYPDHHILAEESGQTHTPEKNSDVVWIIDPLDGTTNFIHGFPHVAISIAASIKGRVEHGIVYDPFRQELFSASRGRGAQLNQQRLRIKRKTGLKEALVATALPFRQKERIQEVLATINRLYPIVNDIRRTGSAALDCAYVAASRFDAYWEEGLHIWDLAAGSLLVREAGGLVCDTRGGDDFLDSGNIACGNPQCLKELLAILRHNPIEA